MAASWRGDGGGSPLPPLQSSGTDMVVDFVQHGQSSYTAALLYQLVTAAIDLVVGKYIQADFSNY